VKINLLQTDSNNVIVWISKFKKNDHWIEFKGWAISARTDLPSKVFLKKDGQKTKRQTEKKKKKRKKEKMKKRKKDKKEKKIKEKKTEEKSQKENKR